jgi:AcrR family transcriptional regulator
MPASSVETRQSILLAGERLFAGHGIDGVSLRDVAAAARVPLALITYHYGTKLALYRAVFEARIAPLSRARRERLAAIMRRPKARRRIGDVIEAFLLPMLESRHRHPHLGRLLGREIGDPAARRRGIARSLLDPLSREYLAALEALLPGRPREDVHWAYHFVVGSMVSVLSNPHRYRRLSKGVCRIDDDQAVLRHFKRVFGRALSG